MDLENEFSGLKLKIINFLKSDSKILPALVLSLSAIILGLFLLINFNSRPQIKKNVDQGEKESLKKTQEETTITKDTPMVFFKTYDNKSGNNAFPFLKSYTFSSYILKANFKNEEILSFGEKLGLDKIDITGGQSVILYNTTTKDKKGVLNFNRKTGSFSFQSFGVLKPKNYTSTQPLNFQAESFLKEIGLFDRTTTCTNAYQKKEMPLNLTFVECHRDWEKTGVPIVSLGGVLNISENKKLADLNIGILDEKDPIDTEVINVKKLTAQGNLVQSINDEGRIRPNDYNTITLGITNDGRIVTIESNLRWIEEVKTKSVSRDLLTPNQAIDIFKTHNYKYALTVPTGAGIVDINKVYPENKAIGETAIISEISLIFLEKPVDVAQEEYELFYLIRGIATLDSGYNVKYVELISALKNRRQMVASAKIYLAQKKNLQLDTFKPSISTPVLTPVPSSSQYQKLPEKCTTNAYGKQWSLNIPGYGILNLVISGSGGGFGHTFYYKSTTSQNRNLQSIKETFYKTVARQYMINVAQWVKDHNASETLNTIEDVKQLFKTINNAGENNMPTANRPAPVILARLKDDIEAQRLVYKQVADGILEAKRNNKISEIALEPDLFPKETIEYFDAVFIDIMRGGSPLREIMPCYLSGVSPIIYLYPSKKTEISVKIDVSLVYADPPINNKWNVLAYPDSVIEQGGIVRSSLYYEYDPSKVSFEEPKTGFVVKTSDWKEFIKNDLSKKFGFNEKETESLIIEVQNTLFNKPKKEYLKISLIDQEELNEKLPLTINPKPDNIYRINLFVKPVDATTNLSNWSNLSNWVITRTGFTVVEIGAYSN